MRVKICGITTQADIELINKYLPDYAGFVFAESKRRVTEENAAALIKNLDPRIKSVGVFVDHTPDEIIRTAAACGLWGIQFHGAYSEREIEDVSAKTGLKTIKCIRVKDMDNVLAGIETNADYILFDTYDKNAPGGTGRTANWDIIREVKNRLAKPFFLAGGINAENVRQAAALSPYAVDVSSGAETAGLTGKDETKLRGLFSILTQGG